MFKLKNSYRNKHFRNIFEISADFTFILGKYLIGGQVSKLDNHIKKTLYIATINKIILKDIKYSSAPLSKSWRKCSDCWRIVFKKNGGRTMEDNELNLNVWELFWNNSFYAELWIYLIVILYLWFSICFHIYILTGK